MSKKAKSQSVIVRDIVRCREGAKPASRPDRLAREEPLEIRVRGQSVAVTMRTPGHDDELAAGFLLTEGLIRERRHITLIAPCSGATDPENVLNVFLASSVKLDLARLTRHVFASSSCGVCGKASIELVHQQFPPLDGVSISQRGGASVLASRARQEPRPTKMTRQEPRPTKMITVSAKVLSRLPARMRKAQATFAQTGGLHAAAIFDAKGKLIVLREDVGRHNAVDKAIGYGFLKRKLPFDAHILLVSGRASFEILQKALAARVPIVCAVSAPSSLAVEFARESGQTLVGFLRGETMNVYSGAERVQ